MNAILNRPSRVLQIALAPFALVAFAAVAQADIYQWEYINPADPNQGKQQSTTLAPDGAGVDAVPAANFSNRDLSMAYLIGADLANVDGFHTNLAIADLSQARLTKGNFANTNFHFAMLAGADLRQANLANADFTEAMLTGASLAGQSLGRTVFLGSDLTDADLTGADVRGTNFDKQIYKNLCWITPICIPSRLVGTGIASAQLYDTASYLANDLVGIGLRGNDLAGANFADQNLSGARLAGATLTGANLTRANLTNADFWTYSCSWDGCTGEYATLTDAYLTAADARGAFGLSISGAETVNLIGANGHMDGLDLRGGQVLIVRDYDGNPNVDYAYPYPPGPPVPITVDDRFQVGPGGTLLMVFEADAWDSTISFTPGIPVTLGGTLELTFATDVNLVSQVGRTFDLVDWTGVTPTGAFAISSPYSWDLSHLYATGEVTLTAIPEPNSLVLICLALCILVPHRNSNRRFQLAAMLSFVAFESQANADIFQWEYINEADPSQGKQQSTTLARDGAGVDAVPGANLFNRNLTIAYLIGADLTGSYGQYANLTNADLSQANLTNASFGAANLTGATFRHANLSNASFQFVRGRVCGFDGSCFLVYDYATLTNSDLTGSDARGALGLIVSDAATANLIRPDGHIEGLDLNVGGTLVVHDYDGALRYELSSPPIAITVDEHLAMCPGGTLRMVFEADAWDSTISFAPGIPVTLGGTLELAFADDVNLASQVGRTLDVFDWTGVTPIGSFAISSPYSWDMSHIYTTGEVTFVGVPEPRALFLLGFALIAHVAMGRVRLRSI